MRFFGRFGNPQKGSDLHVKTFTTEASACWLTEDFFGSYESFGNNLSASQHAEDFVVTILHGDLNTLWIPGMFKKVS